MIVFKLFVVLCLEISMIASAPLPMQLLQPYQRLRMQQDIQQELLELQAMQQFNPMSMPFPLNNPLPPLLFFLPQQQTNTNIDEQHKNANINNKLKLRDHNIKREDEDLDSVVIDAEPVPIIEEQKAILVLPNGRLSIGGLISAIPFLPIEINVPDTISWAYNGIANGIAGIISIIGQRFQKPSMDMPQNMDVKSLINNMKMVKGQENIMRPIVIMPLENFKTPIVPIQL